MKRNQIKSLCLVFAACLAITGCNNKQTEENSENEPEGPVFVVDTQNKRQVVDGIGSSLTESSAYVLACLPVKERQSLLEELFGENGANFPITRTHIGACDFSVEGRYSLAEQNGDTALVSFSMYHDKEGFSTDKYPDIVDSTYDLYYLMKDVADIKAKQNDKTYRVLATTWTAPAWMKDINDYYSKEKKTGGRLLKKYYQTYANYLLKYLEFYKSEGINCWALSPVNEPQGNDGSWESMHFTPQEESEFIGQYLGPTLEKAGYGDVKILGFDQNTFEIGPWTAAIYGDSLSRKYTYGMAVHWYGSSFTSFPEVMDSIHNLYPDKAIIHTEGCIDNLGVEPWDAVIDKEGFVEKNWYKNDKFWWSKEATDWAYSTPFWPELHPKYVPVHRYARFIIEGMNNWMTGFIDWNVVLEPNGGRNHVGNHCGAPIMIDTKNKEIYYTPVYKVLKQLSRNMRPGDTVIYVKQAEELAETVFVNAVQKPDGRIVVNILNTREEPLSFKLKIDDKYYAVSVSANAVQTRIYPAK